MPDETVPEEVALARGLEHIIHWWREPVAGVAALAVGCYDSWVFGRTEGLTSSLDEILIISGIILIAGSRRLIGMGLEKKAGGNGNGNGDK